MQEVRFKIQCSAYNMNHLGIDSGFGVLGVGLLRNNISKSLEPLALNRFSKY